MPLVLKFAITITAITALAAPALACQPPLGPFQPGDVIFDAVALESHPLSENEDRRSLLEWAGREAFAHDEPDTITTFRVVERFRGGIGDTVEIRHHAQVDGAWCLGLNFERGERVFVHAYFQEDGGLFTHPYKALFYDDRQRHLEWARSPRFWLEGSTPYDEIARPPEPPEPDDS